MDEDAEITVTLNMAVYVNDSLTCPNDEDGKQVFRALMLKLHGIIAAAEESAAVKLGKEELWLLQGVAKSAAAVGKERVGWAWLQAVTRSLLHLEAQSEVHQAVMRFGESQITDEDGAARRKMASWPERAGYHDG